MALLHLQQARPQLFPAADRYAYRITNAYSSALSIALGSGRSEASRAEICSAENVARLAQELQGCHTTILCGQRAQWLAPQLHAHLPQLKLVHAWHTSHRALSGKFNPLEVQQLSTSFDRRRMRTTLWAQHVLSQLPLAT